MIQLKFNPKYCIKTLYTFQTNLTGNLTAEYSSPMNLRIIIPELMYL